MGSLTYAGVAVEFDDRLLSHLEIVIVNKLRRQEGFVLSWRDSPDTGDGRSAIWLDPSIPLYFKLEGSRLPAIDRDWIELLAESADSSTGLVVMDESGHSVTAGRRFAVRRTRATEHVLQHL